MTELTDMEAMAIETFLDAHSEKFKVVASDFLSPEETDALIRKLELAGVAS
ncbi:hypothetical protein [Desulfobotulus sp.]|uniref:hypothetical protein n=1 Tax=Desulfobotulus sp. TaxID=1940337 RepID=UPI002A36EAFC|nr:hypothetical protein [Desulfobotulus sp.]MDY0164624.1 hypothetical protein [Desulfobotulus sp.]